MKRPDLNLARKPFVNRRPVSRLAWLLWIVGALLLAVNFNAYRTYFAGSDDKVAEIEQLDGEIREHENEIQRLKSSLSAMDLTQQNEQVAFLNRKIAERTFSWSHLFDQLEEVLPDDVRISSLTPTVTEVARRRRGIDAEEGSRDRVMMSIVAVAKTVDAQLDMVDAFFQHPSFERPKLSSDAQTDSGSRFNLSVVYLPVRPSTELLAETLEEEETEATEETGGRQQETRAPGQAPAIASSRGGGGAGRNDRRVTGRTEAGAPTNRPGTARGAAAPSGAVSAPGTAPGRAGRPASTPPRVASRTAASRQGATSTGTVQPSRRIPSASSALEPQ